MSAHTILWQPPEGCDVLAPTVGGGQAPFAWRNSEGAWRAWEGHFSVNHATTKPVALLLQHEGQPVRAGVDAGRAVLAGTLGVIDAVVGGCGSTWGRRSGGEWVLSGVQRAFSGDLSGFLAIVRVPDPCMGAPDSVARTLAFALAEHCGGRAIFTDENGKEAT